MENTFNQTEKAIVVTSESKLKFKSIVSWGSFLAGLGFVYAGFIIICGLTLTFTTNTFTQYIESDLQSLTNLFGIIYLFMGIIYLIPVIYLHLFCKQIRQSLRLNSQEDFDNGIGNLNKMFTFYGIMTIVAIAIGLLLIPIALFSAVVASFTF